MLEQILPAINEALVVVITASLLWLANAAKSYIESTFQDRQVRDVLLRLEGAVETSVRSIGQTMKEEAKKAVADGKITGDEAKKLKDAAYNSVVAQLSLIDFDKLKDLFGDSLEKKINDMIESVVSKLKDK